MGIIKTVHLIYEYIRHDEEEKVAEVKRAIDGVDLEIEEGSFTAILGHNGSGKSTLAKHINGLLLPTEGTVWVGEIDTKEEDRIWDVRKRDMEACGGELKGCRDDGIQEAVAK